MVHSSDTDPAIIYDFDPRNLPPDFLRALGLVSAASAQTEDTLQHLIGGLAGVDLVETIAITAQMSAALKGQVARALAELGAPYINELDILDDLLDSVAGALERRNALLHNAFCRHPSTGEVLTCKQKARGAVRVSLTPITAADIEADAVAIYEAGMAIISFMVSRGIGQNDRIKPLYEPVDRTKRAREERKASSTRNADKRRLDEKL